MLQLVVMFVYDILTFEYCVFESLVNYFSKYFSIISHAVVTTYRGDNLEGGATSILGHSVFNFSPRIGQFTDRTTA